MSLISSLTQMGGSFLNRNAAGLGQPMPGGLDATAGGAPGGLNQASPLARNLVQQAEQSLAELASKGVGATAGRSPGAGAVRAVGEPAFGALFKDLLGEVQAKEAASTQAMEDLMTGRSDNLHQAVIAMNETSVAFSMMVEVRNKLVEAYQELMRLQV